MVEGCLVRRRLFSAVSAFYGVAMEDRSGKDVQLDYNTSLQPLAELLTGVTRPGDYFSTGNVETPLPTLTVEGVGTVSFPVPPAQARELIAVAAERAPYGRGDQTLVDDSVRKVWQIPPAKVSLRGAGWTRTLAAVMVGVATELGCEPAHVAAEFYKLLIYDEGGFFAAHRDTEKAPGMFGSLVVTLPSAHEGGDLVIRHADRETVLSLRNAEPGEIRYAAFYTDCEHEVRPVTRGYRVCLVYNLVFKTCNRLPTPPDHRQAVTAAAERLRPWVERDGDPDKLVYLLEHHYTQAALSWGALKGADAARAAVLREATAAAGCAVHLGIVHIEESGWAEHDGWGDRRRGRRYWDDEDDEEEENDEEDQDGFAIGEVYDGHTFIDTWRDVADKPVAMGEVPLGDEEVLPAGALDGAKPDAQHFSEATGNEGASFERTYLRAAIVLWPLARTDVVCASAGIDASIVRLGQLVAEIATAPGDSTLSPRVREIALHLVDERWDDYENQGARIDALLGHLARFGDAALIGSFARLWTHFYQAERNPALLALASVLGPERMADQVRQLFAEVATTRPDGCLRLWRGLALGPLSEHRSLLAGLFDQLVAAVPGFKAVAKPSKSTRSAAGYRIILEETASRHRGAQPITTETLAAFLAIARSTLDLAAVETVLGALARNPAAIPPRAVLLPATQLLVRAAAPADVTAALWRTGADVLLARSAVPPPEPTDWAQSTSVPGTGRDPLLRELANFARDPVAREHRFRVAAAKRMIVHQAIEEAALDMTHITERRGSPYTLVCTKTRATFDAAVGVYEADLADMRELLDLPPASARGEATVAAALRAAVGETTKNGM